jgi:uncharacterized protein (TIGR00369 family)
MSDTNIPEGFEPFPLDNSFNDACSPLYLALTDNGPQLGINVKKKHLNPMGICHGAVYMTMLDIALASIIGHTLGKFVGTPTININIDYMASSKEGEWLFVDAECMKLTNTMGFAKGVVRSSDEVKVSGSGIFKLPRNIEQADGITIEQLRELRS